jgi:hypothetical protein
MLMLEVRSAPFAPRPRHGVALHGPGVAVKIRADIVSLIIRFSHKAHPLHRSRTMRQYTSRSLRMSGPYGLVDSRNAPSASLKMRFGRSSSAVGCHSRARGRQCGMSQEYLQTYVLRTLIETILLMSHQPFNSLYLDNRLQFNFLSRFLFTDFLFFPDHRLNCCLSIRTCVICYRFFPRSHSHIPDERVSESRRPHATSCESARNTHAMFGPRASRGLPHNF